MSKLSYPEPVLEDGVVRLRNWQMTDIDCIRLAATDPEIPIGTTVPAVFSPEAAQAFVARQWNRLEHGEGISFAVALAESDVAVGITTLIRHSKYESTYEIGYWLAPDARGNGLAGRAITLASRWAISLESIERIEAHVKTDNIASIKTLAMAGFRQEGVLRRYLKIENEITDAAVLAMVKEPTN